MPIIDAVKIHILSERSQRATYLLRQQLLRLWLKQLTDGISSFIQKDVNRLYAVSGNSVLYVLFLVFFVLAPKVSYLFLFGRNCPINCISFTLCDSAVSNQYLIVFAPKAFQG